MTIPVSGIVGPQSAADGTALTPFRQGKLGEIIASELHGRFYEQTSRGNVYFVGTTSGAALSGTTITLTATSTPILGLYNPTTSGVNAVLLQAQIQINLNTVATPTAPGIFVWASSVGNTAVSTGLTPWNTKTLQQAGSLVKGFAAATALTGLTNNLTLMAAADFPNEGFLAYGSIPTTVLTPSVGGIQNFDGSLFVPPGGVLSLVNTVSTGAFNVSGRLLWEEVAV